ncbi:tetratricopeptide repeat protein [Sulfuriroseicoccus oceanibius]|uniref:Tetratricopeptide repeat protein n=1 Tax=Sulfuriroseicoccus oceanibius TaxID=2707525 RepID=A0A7T7EZH0_9BACT|nr:hypothetical protein [Sulfuriroseicoccus oceanibius]QQL44011.1 hypothetical protein G3M56_008895 [Sulfuriroseicoccus oceanibius]
MRHSESPARGKQATAACLLISLMAAGCSEAPDAAPQAEASADRESPAVVSPEPSVVAPRPVVADEEKSEFAQIERVVRASAQRSGYLEKTAPLVNLARLCDRFGLRAEADGCCQRLWQSAVLDSNDRYARRLLIGFLLESGREDQLQAWVSDIGSIRRTIDVLSDLGGLMEFEDDDEVSPAVRVFAKALECALVAESVPLRDALARSVLCDAADSGYFVFALTNLSRIGDDATRDVAVTYVIEACVKAHEQERMAPPVSYVLGQVPDVSDGTLHQIAKIVAQSKNPNDVVTIAERIEASYEKAVALVLAAEGYIKRGENEKAVKLLEKAHALAPSGTGTEPLGFENALSLRHDMAEAYGDAGMAAKAAKLSDEIYTIVTADSVYSGIIETKVVDAVVEHYVAAGKTGKASGFLKHFSSNIDAFGHTVAFGEALIEAGESDEALGVYSRCLDLIGKDSPRAVYASGVVHGFVALDRLDLVDQTLEAVAPRFRSTAVIRCADQLLEEGALDHIDALTERLPNICDRVDLWARLATAYQKHDQPEEARGYLEKALVEVEQGALQKADENLSALRAMNALNEATLAVGSETERALWLRAMYEMPNQEVFCRWFLNVAPDLLSAGRFDEVVNWYRMFGAERVFSYEFMLRSLVKSALEQGRPDVAQEAGIWLMKRSEDVVDSALFLCTTYLEFGQDLPSTLGDAVFMRIESKAIAVR